MIRRLCLAALAAFALPASAMAQLGPPQDRYIVVLNEGLGMPEDVAADVALRTGGRVGYVYQHALRGFSITMPRAALAGVRRDPRVAYVEEDRPVRAFEQIVPTGITRIFSDASVGDGNADTVNVDVAVLDTGIDANHQDLTVAGGANCLSHSGGPPWQRTYTCNETGDFSDGNSHGTHVAGTIGAKDNGVGVVGVAPGARLWAVKVLDDQGSGSFGGIIAGIDWIVTNKLDTTTDADDIEVINMSLGGETGGPYDPMDQAITAAVNAGVTVVVAAGNSDADTKNYSPANSPDAFTVSALADSDGAPGGIGGLPSCRTDEDDTLANFSNWDPIGDLIDIVAPGVCILSTVPSNTYATFSGTSMASPHAAGAAALLASGDNPPAGRSDVEAIWHTLKYNGNCDWVDDSDDGFKEHLLDVSVLDPGVAASDCALDETGGGGGGGGDGAAVMYVWDIVMSHRDYGPGGSFKDLTTTVTIRRDSDADGVAEAGDEPAASANITIQVTLADGQVFEGSTSTDGSGSASYVLKRVPTGTHTGDVSALTHATYTWNAGLDAEAFETHLVD